ncbi:nucleoside triphosphate pyrophosphohydrolase [Oceanospirillaceae bacterium]|jgi:ATP diphosphatase|nr:nucleoside triphosphate pyrophosphohydrolase [Oceanospirillaceae bacterium]MDB4536699.1 nucleoside triphosphate pyrophosphohydrolase [Oceanospirillaceae bacterium]MDB9904419.1 nucleoside triphosphate pyrophosphohydrolase [Oceanospirillaceae bacterium]MDC0084517.1 nucleoside triphosphate pyrophosphohydrolase [Oceanospirillaceae bacterium]MDC1227399.1 nucleoside triphosphate pyrophosphohydrolase [Oceanospirillaceae bacterium]|tara:strand:- start:54 stop:881 length:828 start_codon:yes stop_codon:yes gene_type:complete
MVKPISNTGDAMQQLLAIMAQLRNPEGGCPWDLKQDFRSILPHTLEEAYEVADAIESDDRMQLRDELGDLLFQVVFYCQLAREEGSFEFADVAQTMSDKLIRRHPHVFFPPADEAGLGTSALDADQVLQKWEAIKQAERDAKHQHSVLDDVPNALPAMQRSAKLQKRAANVGFDWPDVTPVLANMAEELEEIEQAFASGDKDHTLEELGDLMFACVNMARHLKQDPEQVMRAANAKFERRFRFLETQLVEAGESLESVGLERMEAGWKAAKVAGL